MIKICLIGASGKMGRAVIEEANNHNDIEITNFIVHEKSEALNSDVGKFHFEEANNKIFEASINHDFDCIIDFATREKVEERIRLYARLKRPVLFCTTGLKSNELEGIKNLSLEMPIFMAPNTSLVIALMHDLVEKVMNFNNSLKVKISEKHHTSKLDKPSGTALSFAKLTNVKESKIESLREGEAGNWHKIDIFNNSEQLELKHSASNGRIYAQGALNIVKWFYQKPKNLYYMQTLIEDLYE